MAAGMGTAPRDVWMVLFGVAETDAGGAALDRSAIGDRDRCQGRYSPASGTSQASGVLSSDSIRPVDDTEVTHLSAPPRAQWLNGPGSRPHRREPRRLRHDT